MTEIGMPSQASRRRAVSADPWAPERTGVRTVGAGIHGRIERTRDVAFIPGTAKRANQSIQTNEFVSLCV
jgi:hypothetical protein